MQSEKPFFKRPAILVLSVLVGLSLAYWIVLSLSRLGEVPVTLVVIPSDSQVTLNGKAENGRKLYLSPGSYTFTAKREGFKDDKQVVKVGDSGMEVGLIPAPNSEYAYDFLERNPELQQQREAIGGQRANAKGLAIETKTPLVTLLPYIDETGPFSIDYGPSETRENDIFLIISDSSPEGRTAALKWIRSQGYDPTDLEIRFDDFTSPLGGSQ